VIATARQRLLTAIDPADLVDLASALIRIPSFKTEETPAAPVQARVGETVLRQAVCLP